MKISTSNLKQIIREEYAALREVFAAATKPPAGATPTTPPGTPTAPETKEADAASEMSQAGEEAPTSFAALIENSQVKTALEGLKGKFAAISGPARTQALALVMDRLGATEDDINKLKLKISENIQ